MNSSNTLQTEEPGIGNDSFYAASAVSPNANHQDKTSSLFTIERVAEPLPNAAQTLEDPHVEDPESQQQYLDCLTQVWHREIHLSAWRLEDYSSEAHLFTVMAAIQYSEKIHNTKGHQNFERVLCLILPSRLVESVSSASILHCQSFLQEGISRRGLLHHSEGSVFVLR
jgi:hypothetical protein